MATTFTAVPIDPSAVTVELTYTITPLGGVAAAPVVASGPIATPIDIPGTPPFSVTGTQVQINAVGERTNVSPPGSAVVADGFPGLTPAAPTFVTV